MPDVLVDVANALHWAYAIRPNEVIAEVNEGVVTLHGVVERAYQRSYAEAVVRGVPGVTMVRNDIALRTAGEAS